MYLKCTSCLVPTAEMGSLPTWRVGEKLLLNLTLQSSKVRAHMWSTFEPLALQLAPAVGKS